MRDQIVFVLGAGFSAHAQFPLVQQLRRSVFEWLDSNKAADAKLRVHLHPSDWFPEEGQFWAGLRAVDPRGEKGFEELMIGLLRLAETNPQHPAGVTERILRYACGRVLWTCQTALQTRPIPAAYLNFAQQSRSSRGILSFNWDLVCEYSLEAARVPWGYAPHSPVPVIKPHGSLNYSDHRQHGLRPELDLYVPISPGSNLSYLADTPFEDPLAPHNENLRYMLFPGDPELLLSGDDPLAQRDRQALWERASGLISTGSKIVFIGYSLPSYDDFAREFLKEACAGKTVEVCNPSEEVFLTFQRVLTSADVIQHKSRFEESRYASEDETSDT